MADMKRSRRAGAEHSEDEEGPDADLTVGILAKHKKRVAAAEGTRSAGVATGSKGNMSAEDDGRQTGTPEADGEANPPKKKRKKGALDRLEERERSSTPRSSTPGNERQDSDQDSAGRKKRKKRKAFHEVDAASLEAKGVLEEQRVRSSEPSSEEEGQILEQIEEPACEGSYATGNGLSNNGNGLRLDKWNLDLNIQETTSEQTKASKVKSACPSLEALDSSPPRDMDMDALTALSGDTLAGNSLRGRRYWDPPEENEQRCFNCGETGHKAWTCPQPKKERPCFVCGEFGHLGQRCPTGKLCFVCGKGGHEARDCPKKGMRRGAGWASGEGQEGSTCYKCGYEGHTRAECWRDYDEADLELIRCYICGQHSHLACVEVVDNGPTTVTCYQCGQAGHTGDGCAQGRGAFERDDGGPTCYRCGEKGHIARGCSKQDNYPRNRRPAYNEQEYRSYDDRYDPDQDLQAYDDLEEPDYDYVHNSRSQGTDGLWLGAGNRARSFGRDNSRYESGYQAGVSKGSNKYGNRRYSDGYGYESRRSSRYEEGYQGYNEEERGRSKSTGRQRWQDYDEPEERGSSRWGKGGQGRKGSRDTFEPRSRRNRY